MSEHESDGSTETHATSTRLSGSSTGNQYRGPKRREKRLKRLKERVEKSGEPWVDCTNEQWRQRQAGKSIFSSGDAASSSTLKGTVALTTHDALIQALKDLDINNNLARMIYESNYVEMHPIRDTIKFEDISIKEVLEIEALLWEKCEDGWMCKACGKHGSPPTMNHKFDQREGCEMDKLTYARCGHAASGMHKEEVITQWQLNKLLGSAKTLRNRQRWPKATYAGYTGPVSKKHVFQWWGEAVDKLPDILKAIVGSGVSIKVKFGEENTDGKIDQTVIFPDCRACGHPLHGGGGSAASTRYQK